VWSVDSCLCVPIEWWVFLTLREGETGKLLTQAPSVPGSLRNLAVREGDESANLTN
jgi:hypothetical protein